MIKIILLHIDTDDLCAEYGQKITSYNSIQELIIESKENRHTVSEIKKLLNTTLMANLYNKQGIGYLHTDVPFDTKILLAIRYLRGTNDLRSYESANYISRIKYISNKAVIPLVHVKAHSTPELSVSEPIII